MKLWGNTKFWRNQGILAGGFLIGLLPAFTATVRGGHITLQISTTPTYRENQLQCSIAVTNQGDEAAANVQAHLEFQGRRYSAASQALLAVGKAYPAEFSINPGNLAGGRYPLAVVIDYTDTNGYSFTALSYAHFVAGEDNPPIIHGVIDPIELSNEERFALRLKNQDTSPHEIKMRLFLPKELSATPVESQIALNPNGEQIVRFQLKNFSALPGSTYQIYVLSEYEEQGKHSCLFTTGTVTIVAASELFKSYRIPLIAGVAFLVLVLISIQFLYRKRHP